MVSCPSCGAGMRFDPVSQKLKCDHCETKLEPEHAVPAQYAGQQEVFDSTMYTCPQCGAELISDDSTAATFCSYCGASVMLEAKAVKMVAPSYVVPFKIAKDSCEMRYKDVIKYALFAPSYLKSEDQVSRLRGIYMPYWNYDFHHEGQTSVMLKESHRRGDYIITDHYRVDAQMQADYRGFAFDASSSFDDELSEAIAPFNARENRPFSAAYLSGFYADTADVRSEVYGEEARAMAAEDMEAELLRRPECKRGTVEDDRALKESIHITNAQVSYFPVWFLANRHGKFVSYAVINGQTGKVAADIPIAYPKYIAASLVLAIPIFFLLNFLLTLKPAALLCCTLVFAFICHVTADRHLNLLHTREYYLNDKGLQSVRGQQAAADWSEGQEEEQKREDRNAAWEIFKPIIMFLCITTVIGILSLFAESGVSTEGMVLIIWAIVFVAVPIFKNQGVEKKNRTKAVRKKKIYKMRAGSKMKVLFKPLLAEVAGVLLLIASPYLDLVYYIGVCVIMFLVLLSLLDLVKIHNRLTMRLPKQFGKRGGDEHEGI